MIIQHITEYRDQDGIGLDITGIGKYFQKKNIPNLVCAQKRLSSKLPCLHPEELLEKSRGESIHVLHFGWSGYPLDFFYSLPGKKILRYHNFTPKHFFQKTIAKDFYDAVSITQDKSLFELESLRTSVLCSICDSEFNANHLISLGYDPQKVMVAPIFKEYCETEVILRRIEKKIQNGSYKKILVIGGIGRIFPNKKWEDLIILTYFLKKYIPKIQCKILGNSSVITEAYLKYLKNLIQELYLEENVKILEKTTEEEKFSHMESFDLFVSMSEHEGFGIPLLEAVEFGIPVFAFQSSSISETMQGKGILFPEKNFEKLVNMILYIHENESIAIQVAKSQAEIMDYYRSAEAFLNWEKIIQNLFPQKAYEN